MTTERTPKQGPAGATQDQDQETAPPAEEAPPEGPERVVSVEQWVNAVAAEGPGGNLALGLDWRTQEHPPFELLGGFVHKMKSEGVPAAKPSVYLRRWKAFLKE